MFFYYLRVFLCLLSLIFLVQWGYSGTKPPTQLMAYWGIAFVIDTILRVIVQVVAQRFKEKLKTLDDEQIMDLLKKEKNNE